MKKMVVVFFWGACFILYACGDSKKVLLTKSVTVGDNKCIVQQMPSSFQEGNSSEKSQFDYFRVILESKAKLKDSSYVNYINFGMESSLQMIVGKDTIPAAFAQRVANGKKDSYEYIVAFEKKQHGRNFEILIKDQALGIGQVAVKF
jgi:hypothetical protein